MAIDAKMLTHLCFVTTDVERLSDWYGRMFGYAPHTRFETPEALTHRRTKGEKESADVVIGELGGRALEIGQYRPIDPPRVGFSHFGIRVDDVDAAYAHAVANGADVYLEPFEAAPGLRIFFINDPDGNQIEVGNLPDLTRPYEAI